MTRAFRVGVVGDDRDAVDVSERALALLVGIAREGAGAVAAQTTPRKRFRAGIVPERSRVPTRRVLGNVAKRSAAQQLEVACGRARGAERHHRGAERDLGGERLQSVVIEVISGP